MKAENVEPVRAAQALAQIRDLYEIEREIAERKLQGEAKLEVRGQRSKPLVDTNHLERALRPIPMGRKAWFFCWTEVGAEIVGIIQSLISTCGLHDVEPCTYRVDVLQRIDTHPFAHVEQLTPRLWKEHFADDPLRSLLAAPSP